MPPKDPFTHLLPQGKRDSQLRLHKPEPDPEAGVSEALGPRQYQAFETAPRPARLIIQCSNGPSHSPAYPLLVNVIFDRRFGGSFVLVYNFMAVIVTGRNLGPMVHAINKHRCTAITEYDPQAFEHPPGDAPVIERIEVQAGAAMGEQIERVATKRG
jgi:hypothetical protein